jgi:hypothetical protein
MKLRHVAGNSKKIFWNSLQLVINRFYKPLSNIFVQNVLVPVVRFVMARSGLCPLFSGTGVFPRSWENFKK